ncbi:hypothetical protein BC332_26698 [Capsicum chinense]|uniref:calmodulin-binding protein 25 n=1 Tax=Capsicum annuum TaxID=4072 RepID=UPI0007BF062E|nr:calmodulin-binding protein 25 [Capsicum annuum]KAF3614785.1 hypothetical protein FXO37_35807 [Capsicum annuum]KAF3642066.1 hypothetical protein FXO38_21297 [Capsicum annuum]PHU05876.1 hypothetical protein BC332_26698 [Capsicum chinense]
MAFSDNLMAMEQQWGFRSMLNETCFSDIFAKETETLTKVLMQNPVGEVGSTFKVSSSASDPTVSGGSDHSAASSMKQQSGGTGTGGGVMSKKIVKKRKPRASKRASTTYITADVDSFRQMVQQVTGIGQLPVNSSIVKPEARRPVDRVQPVSFLPTLDTSALLLDPNSGFMHPPLPPPAVGGAAVHQPSAVVVDGGFGFDSFCGFPTLESGM